MKRTIIIDTEEKRVELLHEGYNIIEDTVYESEGEIVKEAEQLLNKILFLNVPY